MGIVHFLWKSWTTECEEDQMGGDHGECLLFLLQEEVRMGRR